MKKELVFLLEESSMEAVLKVIIPKIVPHEMTIRYLSHEGKKDLEKSIPIKLRAWQNPEACFVIVHDQDDQDCIQLKQRLQKLCGPILHTRCVLIRIVCHELESWFLGDLPAVDKAFKKTLTKKLQNKAKYRTPDAIRDAKTELKRLVAEYQAISGSRAIAPLMDLDQNRSQSFKIFLEGIKRLCGE